MHGERELFERLLLESFQSGLSWLTILRRREGFRRAFEDWDVAKIASYGEPDVARLIADEGVAHYRSPASRDHAGVERDGVQAHRA